VQKLRLLAAYYKVGSALLLDALCQVAQAQKVLAYLKASLLMSQEKFLLAWFLRHLLEWLLKCLWVQQRHQPFLLVRLLEWPRLLLEWLHLSLVKL
jgi:hypothetical protein